MAEFAGFVAICLAVGLMSAALVCLMVLHNLAIEKGRKGNRS